MPVAVVRAGTPHVPVVPLVVPLPAAQRGRLWQLGLDGIFSGLVQSLLCVEVQELDDVEKYLARGR